MNKKSRGFTLVEMLAVIAIISVITLVATITYNKVRKDVINKQFDNLEALIETAGIKYAAKTGIRGFFVEELIKEGYLEPDDDDNQIYDPRNHESLNCHIVKVKIDENDKYTASLSTTEYRNDNGCDKNKTEPYNNNLYLTAKIHGTSINYLTSASSEFGSVINGKSDNVYKNVKIVSVSGNRWTNKQLDITANLTVDSVNYPLYGDPTTQSIGALEGARYIWNKNPDTSSQGANHTTSVVEFFDNNYYLDVYTANDDHYQGSVLYKYDNQKPVIYEETITYASKSIENAWATSKRITFSVTDKDGVGLDRVYAGTRPCSDLLKDSSLGDRAVANSVLQSYVVNDVESGKDGENGRINICAVDKLGNLADTGHFTIKKVDITKPHCKKKEKAKRSDDVIDEHNKYQYYDRTIRQYCYDNNRINGILVIGSGCDGSKDSNGYVYFQKTFSPSSGSAISVGEITIKDKVGHTKDCDVDVYVDRKAPNCSTVTGHGHDTETFSTGGVGSTSNWDISDRSIRQYCTDDHVGCRLENGNTYYSKSWHEDLGGIIYTDTIKIYDKVPQCSQESTLNNNCKNVNLNSSSNLYDSNNSRVCTVGVYIDHVPPVVTQGANAFHNLNRLKVYCSDTVDGVAGSGVDTFEASATTGGDVTIRPCSDGATGCSTSNSTISNTTGDGLQFKVELTKTVTNADVVSVSGTCVDNAGNVTEKNAMNFQGEVASSIGNDYIGVTVGGCQLKEYRAKTAAECAHYSYDCSAHDTPCGSNNSGERSSCCLQGADPAYGCKVAEENRQNYKNFGSAYPRKPYNKDPRIQYIEFGGKYYLTPKNEDPEYLNCYDEGGVVSCTMGRECLIFNCYPDFPLVSAQEVRNYVCGNYTR